MNYTAEDLKNTKIRIESPEHSKYVQELAFSLFFGWFFSGGKVNYTGKPYLYFDNGFYIKSGESEDFFSKDEFKEIKIPMPKEKEWPQVGDEVEFKLNPSVDYSWVKAKVLFVGSKHTILKSQCGREYSRRNAKLILREAKTPEQELLDELTDMAIKQITQEHYAAESNAYYLALRLTEKYSITKRVNK